MEQDKLSGLLYRMIAYCAYRHGAISRAEMWRRVASTRLEGK
jgi:hypothetical protein